MVESQKSLNDAYMATAYYAVAEKGQCITHGAQLTVHSAQRKL